VDTKNTQLETQKEETSVGMPTWSPGTLSNAVMPTDSQWVTFGDRVTYTFVYGKEVGSIHFDKERAEIFFKGHNIRNMELEEWHWQILEKMRVILGTHNKLRNFITPYSRLLEKVVLEKKR